MSSLWREVRLWPQHILQNRKSSEISPQMPSTAHYINTCIKTGMIQTAVGMLTGVGVLMSLLNLSSIDSSDIVRACEVVCS